MYWFNLLSLDLEDKHYWCFLSLMDFRLSWEKLNTFECDMLYICCIKKSEGIDMASHLGYFWLKGVL